MLKPQEHFHGSDLEKIEQIYNIRKEDITSFSANVNPLGISPKLKQTLSHQIDAITGYPDREYSSLRNCMAEYINGKSEYITVGNGSTELIGLFIQLVNPKNALLLSPTYSEYEREITLSGGICTNFELKESDDFKLDLHLLKEALREDVDMLIICNPNNPTSTSIFIEEMEELLVYCNKLNITVMVDETYVEFAPDIKKVTSVSLVESYDNLIILRGISKFFAAPGLRLGYAICSNKNLMDTVNKKKNPWSINTLAAIAGEIMFTDKEYINDTWQLIHSERNRIVSMLQECKSIKVYEPTANFLLIKILKEGITSSYLFDLAIKHGFMIRDCSTFTYLDNTFIRFCFMEKEKNTKLVNLILDALK